MDLNWTQHDLAFRDEVRAFLAERLTPELRAAGSRMTSVYADHDASMQWQRILHERGWAAPAWPVEYGGCDWSLTQHYIFTRELALAGAPPLSPMGIQQVAYAIQKFGTAEQKDYFLPRILTGEAFFCQGYSEPESGSDLASLSMRAVEDGDDLVCTGSKIWTTHANVANWMFALLRTSRGERKQQGITFALVDMTVPGIRVRPLVMTSGEQIQNQVYFDEVRVSKANVIGRIDDGWTVAKYLLEYERGGSAIVPGLQVMAESLAAYAATVPAPGGGTLLADAGFARRFADARIRTEVLEILEYRVLTATVNGQNPGTDSSMLKILTTELRQVLTELAMEAAGVHRRVYQPHAVFPGGPVAEFQAPPDGYVSGGSWPAAAALRYFNDRAGSIYGGSNEIQRNILAKATLGL